MQSEPSFPQQGVNELFAELWTVYLARIVRLLTISFLAAAASFALTSAIDAVLPEGNLAEIEAILAEVPAGELPTEQQSARITELQLADAPLTAARWLLGLASLAGVSAVAAGAYIYVVGGHYVRGKVAMSEAFAFALRRAGGLLVTTFLAMGAVLAVWGAAFALPILLSSLFSAGSALSLFFALLSVPGLFIAIALTVYVLVRWAFIWPAVALDGLASIPALRRSWLLTEGHWWRVFMIMLMILFAALALYFLSDALIVLAASVSGSDDASTGWPNTLRMWNVNLVFPTVAGALQPLIIFLLYADLRTRKEAPDGYGPTQIAQELHLTRPVWDDAP